MYNNRHGCGDNWRKEYLASNQVVGGSSPSGRAIKSRSYGAFKKCTIPQIAVYPTIRVMSAVETLADVLGNYRQYWNFGVQMALSIIWKSV